MQWRRRWWAVGALLSVSAMVASAQVDSNFASRRFFGVAAGLGVSVVLATDIVDYINSRSAGLSRQDDFTAAAEFFGNVQCEIMDGWNAKLEYAYLLKSYNVPQPFGRENVYSYTIHMPTAIVHYTVKGLGFLVKFGGGAGYHVAQFRVEDFQFSTTTYRSSGIGIKVEVEANTAFDDHLFGYIGGDIRDSFMSALKDDAGKTLVVPSSGENAKLGFFSLGLKFGLSYYF